MALTASVRVLLVNFRNNQLCLLRNNHCDVHIHQACYSAS